MPLQHASDRMLKIMKRGHGIDRQRKVVETLRNKVDNLVFRTAFIVGHPGETDEDFEELTSFVEWAQFDRVGVFTYSHEEDTSAAKLEDDVSEKIKRARSRKLHAIQRAITRKKTRAMIGRARE
jgi:ribosomal protein S12 methylthiotransferase